MGGTGGSSGTRGTGVKSRVLVWLRRSDGRGLCDATRRIDDPLDGSAGLLSGSQV
jgi:hypothetical protein